MTAKNTPSPAQTLYINNLNDKIHKQDLRRLLYYFFIPYGHILDVVALKTPELRGQAWVVFSNSNDAAVAMKAAQGTELAGKTMRIALANEISNAAFMAAGIYNPDAFRKHLAKKAAAMRKRKNEDEDGTTKKQKLDNEDAEDVDMEQEENNEDETEATRILLITGLSETTSSLVQEHAEKVKGFESFKMVPGKTDVAFAEFNSRESARKAKLAIEKELEGIEIHFEQE